jgi:hypothetical protein
MDGNSELTNEQATPGGATPPQPSAPPKVAGAAAAGPKVKTFHCPGCGSPLTVRGMTQTEAIACGSCGSIIDLTDENLRILSTFQSKVKYQPLIPLGARGKVRGETFEVIGYLRRRIEVDQVPYEWSEYLLFNPYKGFRWLTEYNGHWNFVKTTTNIPRLINRGGRQGVNYLGTNFLHFQSATAQVSYVVGEFYWRVEVGETAEVDDFVAPPLMISRETTAAEVSWSVGEYLEPDTLWQGFQLKTSPPTRIGVAPNQPSPLRGKSTPLMKLLLVFWMAALLMQIFRVVTASNQKVYENDFRFERSSAEKSLVTDVFEFPSHTSNIVIRSKADIENSWIFLNMALINEETGNAYDFGREISFYHGVDGGESWSEGSHSDEAVLPAVPPGRYYLRIEPESESAVAYYHITVYQDVPRWSFLFITMGLLAVLPIWQWLRGRHFEMARWAESDHPRMTSSSSSSDDD